MISIACDYYIMATSIAMDFVFIFKRLLHGAKPFKRTQAYLSSLHFSMGRQHNTGKYQATIA